MPACSPFEAGISYGSALWCLSAAFADEKTKTPELVSHQTGSVPSSARTAAACGLSAPAGPLRPPRFPASFGLVAVPFCAAHAQLSDQLERALVSVPLNLAEGDAACSGWEKACLNSASRPDT